MIRKFFAVSLISLATAVFSYGTYAEIAMQVAPRDSYIFPAGVIGIAALIVSSVLVFIGYQFWRWTS